MDITPFLGSSSDILDRLHDAVISTDLQGVVIYCNVGAEKIYEYSRQEFIGMNVSCLYPKSELPRMTELVQEVRTKGKFDGEFLNCTKSGREIYIHLSVSLLLDQDGEPYGMIGFSIDITNQKLADHAQREAEQKYREARAVVGLGMWHWDVPSNRLRWDEVSSKLLGNSPDSEQSLENFIQCIHPSERSRIRQIIQDSLISGSEYSAEYRVVHRDGSEHWIQAQGKTLVDTYGKPVEMLGTAIDITEKKLAEAKLQRAEAKYKVLFESPLIGVIMGNLDVITDANDAYCNMIGYTREELASGAVRWQDITPPEHLKADFSALQQMLSTGTCSPFEKEYFHRDGRRVRVLLGAALVSREPVVWSGFALDISDTHRALMAVRHSEQLTAAARMGSALAHEINNPLAALTNIVYLMRYGSTTRRDELVASAEEALDRVSRITRQMIGIYSEAETVAPFNVSNVLDDTLAGYASQLRSKNLSLVKRVELGSSVFRGVEADVRRLLTSLVENAVEHAPPGGSVKIHLFKGREWRKEQAEGLKIVISDNGPGIPKEGLQHLFEPFYSTKKTKATGLGLWTTRNIVEKYKGSLRVRSSTSAGRSGTCVSIFLRETGVLSRKRVS
jgi:PAS domain S-box-containing protein